MRGGKGGTVRRTDRDRVAAGRTGPFLAEGQAACAGVQLQRLVQLRPIAADKAGKAAVMVAVRMAEYQAVEPFRLDAEQVKVAVQHLGGETEIEQILIAPTRRLGF